MSLSMLLSYLRWAAVGALLVLSGALAPCLLLLWYDPPLVIGLGSAAHGVVIRDGAALYPVLGPIALDGDTVRGTIQLPYQAGLCNVAIRAADYDAWESSRSRRTVEITPEELERGRAAQEMLAGLLTAGQLYLEPDRPSGRRDAYGRPLGLLWIRTPAGDWWSVRETMQQGGHCRPAR